MTGSPHAETGSADARLALRVFGTACGFLVVTAALGSLLRWQMVSPVAGLNYHYFLHAHSHVAFLGWVFNAFFALALLHFAEPGDLPAFRRLFIVAQLAVVGMLISYPLQGYGTASIAFSTLHMACSAVFAWKLWRRNRASAAAHGHLRTALAFMAVSGLGPLTLGPLAALGLRDSPAYLLAIYFYLHCQYNGWFMFFLQALVFQDATGKSAADGRRALVWLGAGAVLTLALSALWLHPPAWVRAMAAAGGAAQLVGCVYLVRGLRGRPWFAGAGRWLAGLALAGFLLKHALQAASAWPGLAALVNHRFTVIAFLHLVFLGVVTPLLLAWALRLGWLRDGWRLRTGLGVFFGGALVSELAVAGVPLNLVCPHLMEILLASALALLAGSAVIVAGLAPKTTSGAKSID